MRPNIRQWRLKKDQLQQIPKKKMREAEKGKQRIGVSMMEAKIKAKIIAKQMKIKNFRASKGWIYRFFYLSMRKTHIAQRLPED